MTGGLAWNDAPPFVSAVYAVPGMKSNVDGVAYHPYGITVESSYALTRGVRQAVDAADARAVPGGLLFRRPYRRGSGSGRVASEAKVVAQGMRLREPLRERVRRSSREQREAAERGE
jgi:hypothetical protein